ncbi:MAG: radical SAM protein [Acidobacteriota bacterium]|nr:radical SAM protein [Acidobacteriota bacterium]
MKSAYCVNLGCSENMLDGALITEYLKTNDWQLADDPGSADLIIVNSCGVTEASERRSLDTYRQLVHARPHARVILAGCLPAINKSAVREAGYTGVRVTPRTLHALDAVTGAHVPLDSLRSGCVPVSSDQVGLSFSNPRHAAIQARLHRLATALGRVAAVPVPRWLWQYRYYPDADTEFIRISVGCMNQCSFCAIPRAKGRTRSVPEALVVDRVEDAVRRGKTDIALSCDELASYGQDLNTNIAVLLDRLTSIPGDFRLSLRNVHPEWMIRYWPDVKPTFARQKIAYALIPLQSGSDRLLSVMNRNHTAQQYRRLIDDIRATSPGTVLRTHLLVGYPGETDREFGETFEFMKRLRVDSFFVHVYSERSFTASAGRSDRVPQAVAQARAAQLRRLSRTTLCRPFRWLPLRPL